MSSAILVNSGLGKATANSKRRIAAAAFLHDIDSLQHRDQRLRIDLLNAK